MQSRCCWPPERPKADICRRSFTSSQSRVTERLFNSFSKIRLAGMNSVDLDSVGDVVEYRLRKRIRLLENHPDLSPECDDIGTRRVDVLTVDHYRSLDTRTRDRIVHPVQRAYKSRLPAARRTDEGDDFALRYLKGDIVKRLRLTVEKIQIGNADFRLHKCRGLRSTWTD